MFGFGQKAKLKKIGEELKGASLAEVVEKFADSKLIERPSLAYDKEVAIIYKENITSEEEQDAELLLPKIKKITADNKLEEGSHNIYLACNTFENLRIYALDLTLATKFMDNTDDAVNYLFDTWLKVPPIYYVLPILFPAKCGGRIEDFSIDRDVRFAMIDGLFGRLNNTEGFSRLVNAFADEHPYFRQYPL